MLVVQCVFFQTLHIHSLTKHLQVSLQKEMPIFKRVRSYCIILSSDSLALAF